MPTKTLKVELAVFDAAAAAKYDEFLERKDLASRGRKADEEARELKQQLIDLMGDAEYAELPDGRRLRRNFKSYNRPAQEPKRIEYWDLEQVQ